ncbi:MAG TPA: hypothetical protein VFH39_05160 [Candidatus Saccharimonadales bacterium]|nr:hypothetical protein [Candidatus Saccharimonadales bacterium]
MWLKRLVGVMMIIAFGGLNTLVVLGLFQPRHPHTPIVNPSDSPATVSNVAPTVNLSVGPSTVATGLTSAIQWTTTGTPDSCTASGDWSGDKTIYGAESTGRLPKPGTYTYKLTCRNKIGSATASATVTVTNTPPATSRVATSTGISSSPAVTATYCSGRSPCYGKADVARHSSAGDCWGYNLDRVIDISGFDLGYHIAKSGISSIRISGVCGTNLAPALDGSLSAGGQTRNHLASTKSNSDPNEIPYFVGFFDPNKP